VPDLGKLNFDELTYYIRPEDRKVNSWEEVPVEIKNTFEKLGIPQAERKYLAGVVAQYESEGVYSKLKKQWEDKGVIMTDMDTAVQRYPELVRKYFMKCVPPADNKFSALHGAVWSGGSFVYVPAGVKVDLPLQTYFRMNAANEGQFEHTLIVAEEGSNVHYIEGCFTKGAKVSTKNGEKKIEEVKEGDEVLTHKSRFRKVYRTQVRPYSGPLYSIQCYGDTNSMVGTVTAEHPFFCVKRQRIDYKNTEWNAEWVKAGDLQKGDYLAIPIDDIEETSDARLFAVKIGHGRHAWKDVELPIITDADFFRLVGYYIAEGTTIGEHYVTFTFNKNEREYVEDVAQLLERYFGKAPLEYKEYKNGISVVLCSTLAARFFIGQFGNHAATKHLPEWVMKENRKKQGELIKGFWRGDGSFMCAHYSWGIKRMFRINTISEKLAIQVRQMLLRIRIFASLNRAKRTAPRHDMLTVYVGGAFLGPFAELVDYKIAAEVSVGNQKILEVLSTRAKSYACIQGNLWFVPIKSITKTGSENIKVYNFGVEEDESYVACGVAVHNCTAPRYSTASLHSAVVEIYVKKNAHARYTTVQNWSKNVYNLNTKRAIVEENGFVEWVGGSLGGGVSMLYPCSVLSGRGARAEHLNIAIAGKGTIKEGGAKVIHAAPDTQSKVVSKSISSGGGHSVFRGLVRIHKGAIGSKASMRCDALMLDAESKSDTFPSAQVWENDVEFGHEATAGRISEEQLFYLQSRGLTEAEAAGMIVLGFIEPVVKEIPLEYAVELNRLITLEMEGSIG
jgi:Fe-S cluster assembly protein SufB